LKKKYKPRICYSCGYTEFVFKNLKGMLMHHRASRKILDQNFFNWVCGSCDEYCISGRDCDLLDSLMAHSPDTFDKESEYPGTRWEHFSKGWKR